MAAVCLRSLLFYDVSRALTNAKECFGRFYVVISLVILDIKLKCKRFWVKFTADVWRTGRRTKNDTKSFLKLSAVLKSQKNRLELLTCRFKPC